ncbi:MAG: oligoendopeptidase F, partial [Rhodobacteraceae bacterium]|nr:oligoendopeptidase F [Paracoccaceae bacterium]
MFTLPPLPFPLRDASEGGGGFGKLPEWNLADLYPGEDSAELSRDLAWLEQECAAFASDYHGRLAGLEAEGMLACIRRYERIQTVGGRVMSFAGLRYYQNTTDAGRSKFYADMQDRITGFTTPLVFFSLEMNRIDDSVMEELLSADPALDRYRPVIERMRKMRPHQLSDEMEQFLHDQSVVGASAWNRLFDETMAGLEF